MTPPARTAAEGVGGFGVLSVGGWGVRTLVDFRLSLCPSQRTTLRVTRPLCGSVSYGSGWTVRARLLFIESKTDLFATVPAFQRSMQCM